MKVLITGGSGQVGFELRRQLATLGEIVAPNRAALDLLDADAVDAFLAQHQPDLIVNAAAYTAVDNAETDLEAATRLNAELPAQLGRANTRPSELQCSSSAGALLCAAR